MRLLFRRTLLTVFVSFGFSAAAESSAPKTYRLVHLTVLNVDGRPAAHRDVYLRGWSTPWGYRCWGPISDNDKDDGWRYATDSAGKVTVPIQDFWDKSGKSVGPGPCWGTYAFVTDAGPDDAGGVSTRFWIGTPPDPKEDWAPNGVGPFLFHAQGFI